MLHLVSNAGHKTMRQTLAVCFAATRITYLASLPPSRPNASLGFSLYSSLQLSSWAPDTAVFTCPPPASSVIQMSPLPCFPLHGLLPHIALCLLFRQLATLTMGFPRTPSLDHCLARLTALTPAWAFIAATMLTYSEHPATSKQLPSTWLYIIYFLFPATWLGDFQSHTSL